MNPFIWTKIWCENQGLPHMTYESIGSTNVEAKRNSMNQEVLTLFLAKTQLVGKGRGKNSWLDNGEDCFLGSWILPTTQSPTLSFSPAVGLALYTALCHTWSELPFSLKAPNDIYLDEKKVSGILIESIAQGACFRSTIGMGINVLSTPHEEGTCIKDFTSDITQEKWFQFLSKLTNELSTLIPKPYLIKKEALLEGLNRRKKEVFIDIDENGSLKLQDGTQIPWEEI